MKIGYINPRRTFTEKAQAEILAKAGVAEKDMYIEGRGGENLTEALRRTRNGLIYCADGMRALGPSAKAIREAMVLIEKKQRVLVDPVRNQRSDKDRWAMYDWACGKVIAEKNGLSPAVSRRGAESRAARIENDRLDRAKAEKIWRDQRFDSNADACAYMNKLHPPKLAKELNHRGWTPQIAYRNFGESGRPRGNRSFKVRK